MAGLRSIGSALLVRRPALLILMSTDLFELNTIVLQSRIHKRNWANPFNIPNSSFKNLVIYIIITLQYTRHTDKKYTKMPFMYISNTIKTDKNDTKQSHIGKYVTSYLLININEASP